MACPCQLVDFHAVRLYAGLDESVQPDAPSVQAALQDVYALAVERLISVDCVEGLCARLGDPDSETPADIALRDRLEKLISHWFLYYYATRVAVQNAPDRQIATAKYETTDGIYIGAVTKLKSHALRMARNEEAKFVEWFDAQRALEPNPYPCAGAPQPETQCGCDNPSRARRVYTYPRPPLY